jgi:hypothetical protein
LFCRITSCKLAIMQNIILSLRKIFDILVLIELDILYVNFSMEHAILFFPTLTQVKATL